MSTLQVLPFFSNFSKVIDHVCSLVLALLQAFTHHTLRPLVPKHSGRQFAHIKVIRVANLHTNELYSVRGNYSIYYAIYYQRLTILITYLHPQEITDVILH